jgi:NADH-quinone oxidoreductase subunit N
LFPLIAIRLFQSDTRAPLVVKPVLHFAILTILASLLSILQSPIFNFFESILQVESNFLVLNMKGITLILTAITLTLLSFYPKEKITSDFEIIPLFLLATVATLFLLETTDLLTLYFSLELQAFSFYILTAYDKKSIFSTEAGIKYFILGAFSSCIILYAIAQIYLTCGTINLINLRHYFTCRNTFGGNT